MIESVCTCGHPVEVEESAVGTVIECGSCKTAIHPVSGEALGEGAGTGDFDGYFVVESGPGGDRVGQVYLLGGVAAMTMGKMSTSQMMLPGTNVSRHHATLERVDFGPSRWRIEDHQSTNGLWVNEERVTGGHDLEDGDRVMIGEYELKYGHAAAVVAEPVQAVVAAKGPEVGRPVCPSCGLTMKAKSKICTDCGIYVATGKPLLTAKGIDENELHIKADNLIRFLSFIFRIGLYPIASEGFGTFKPYALWGLVIFTVLTSVVGFIADAGTNPLRELPATAQFELWVGNPNVQAELPASLMKRLSPAVREELKQMLANRPHGEFHAYQLLTCAFLHGGIMHLAGNLVFMIVLGVSVNTLVGNWKMLVIYPVLAVVSAMVHFVASRNGPMIPTVGASGAIMGLAGMYLVLFPVHKMYMVFWLRLGILTGFRRWMKIWPVRGFWVVLFFISFDVIYTALGVHDNTAHWAHMGGFAAGVVVAMLLLVTRQVNARGGDLLSVTLGQRAWALIGKPASRVPMAEVAPYVPAVRATSLDFPA